MPPSNFHLASFRVGLSFRLAIRLGASLELDWVRTITDDNLRYLAGIEKYWWHEKYSTSGLQQNTLLVFVIDPVKLWDSVQSIYLDTCRRLPTSLWPLDRRSRILTVMMAYLDVRFRGFCFVFGRG